MKKIFSMICALSLAMSTMLISPMVEAESLTFVDDNGPRVITDCIKITSKGLATIDIYLDFEKYDFIGKHKTGEVYDEELEENSDTNSGKGIQAFQVDIPYEQFVGDYVKATDPIVKNTAVTNIPGYNVAYNTTEKVLRVFSAAQSFEEIYIPTEKVKIATIYVYVNTELVDTDKTGILVDENLEITLSNAKVTVWTLDDKLSTSDITETAYTINNIGTIFGNPDNAIVTISNAAGTVATKDANTGKVWNNVKVEEVSKATSYKAVFTDKATGEKAEFAINGLTGDEVNGDATFAVILKLVEKVANSADILLDIVCE